MDQYFTLCIKYINLRLSGNLPFNSHTLSDIFAKTLDGEYSYKGKCWDKVSNKAKNLIDEFLRTEPE